MKRLTSTFLLIFSIYLSGWSQDSPHDFSDTYQVLFQSPGTDRIQIRAKVFLKDSLLYMSPYGPLPERWPAYVRNLEVRDSKGRLVETAKTEDGGWVLPGSAVEGQVVLEYDLVLEHEQESWPGGIDGVAYRREWGILASGRSLFVMNGNDKRDIRVTVSTPEGWKVSAPWPSVEGAEKTYQVADLSALQESFLVVGTHVEKKTTRDGFTLTFVLGGPRVQQEEPRFVQVAQGVMEYYVGLMGGVPKPVPGKKLQNSLVVIAQGNAVDGEVIGQNLSMFMDPDGDPMNQMMGWFMFAHEFFHLWNGKTLRFADTTTDWFKEGISNYYTMKALNQTGFINEDVVLALLNNLFYQRYIQDPGYGSLAPSRAASGFDKDNHWGLIYGGGLFAGIALDMEIRHRSKNAASLDDLMRRFYREFGGTKRTIDGEIILEAANRLANKDFSGFIRASIEGPQPISLKPYLIHAGVTVDTSGGQLSLNHMPEKSPLQEALWGGFLGAN